MSSKNEQSLDRKVRDVGVFVPDVQCKLQFFHAGSIRDGSERIECVHSFGFGSRRALAVSIGLSEAQLKGTAQGASYLSKASIKALGENLGFDPDWPEWKSGTCVAFAKRYNADNRLKVKLLTCIREEGGVAADPQLASLSLRPTKNMPEMPFPLSVDLTCETSPEEELTLWVRDARIVVKLGKTGVTLPVAERKRYPADFEGRNSGSGRATIEPAVGGPDPFWIMKVREGVLGSVSLPHLIEITDIEPGEEVEVSLRVYVKDIGSNANAKVTKAGSEKSMRGGETQSVGWQAAGGSRVSASVAKAAIAQRLAVLELQERTLGADASGDKVAARLHDGWIVLARDQLRFERVSDVGQEQQ
jgi:hypothetical protein